MKIQKNENEPPLPDLAYTEPYQLLLEHPEVGRIGTFFSDVPSYVTSLHGCTISVDEHNGLGLLKPPPSAGKSERDSPSEPSHPVESNIMTAQDRHIDNRLATIEASLDRRIADLQRFQERAEDRFERAYERHDAELAMQRQKTDESYRNLYNLIDGARKHSSNMAAVTIFGTVGGVLAALTLVVTLGAGWISEQGSYARSYGDTQVEIQQAADERAETRETLQSIQATQQTILDRLTPPESQ